MSTPSTNAAGNVLTDLPEFHETDSLAWGQVSEAPLQFQLDGDFYREQDDIMRGCTLAYASPEIDPSFPCYPGSFHDLGSTSKCAGADVGLAPKEYPTGSFGSEVSTFFSGKSYPTTSFGSDGGNVFFGEDVELAEEISFSDSFKPAVADSLRCSGSTAILLEAHSPALVAEAMYAFLRTEVLSNITKVSPHKFAMKADVFQESHGFSANCSLKARVLRPEQSQSPNSLLVEMCRRKGDAVAFQNIFGVVSQYLLQRFPPLTGSECDGQIHDKASRSMPRKPSTLLTAPTLPPPPPESSTNPSELLPLLAMLTDASPRGQLQQAEAVAALVAVASASAAGAVAVCAALHQLAPPDVLASCLSSCCPDVSFPAACLTSILCMHCGTETPALGRALEQLPAKMLKTNSSCFLSAKRAAFGSRSPGSVSADNMLTGLAQ